MADGWVDLVVVEDILDEVLRSGARPSESLLRSWHDARQAVKAAGGEVHLITPLMAAGLRYVTDTPTVAAALAALGTCRCGRVGS
jgi:hypothetical protein